MITRRTFLKITGLTALAATGTSLVGCSGGGTAPATKSIPLFEISKLQGMGKADAKSYLEDAGFVFASGTSIDAVTKDSSQEAVKSVFGVEASSATPLADNDGRYYMVTVPLADSKQRTKDTDIDALMDKMLAAAGLSNPTSRGVIESKYSDKVSSIAHGNEVINTDWANHYAIGTCDLGGTEGIWMVGVEACTYSTYNDLPDNVQRAFFYCGKANNHKPEDLVAKLEFWSEQKNQDGGDKKKSFMYSDRGNYMQKAIHWWEKGL